MAFERELGKDEEGQCITYTPTPPNHPWLGTVQIIRDTEKPIVISIHLKSPDGEEYKEDLARQASNNLLAMSEFLSGRVTHSRTAARIEKEIIEERGGVYVGPFPFECGPTSKIRYVLSQANIPRDIQEAVMTDLQQIWSRTPK